MRKPLVLLALLALLLSGCGGPSAAQHTPPGQPGGTAPLPAPTQGVVPAPMPVPPAEPTKPPAVTINGCPVKDGWDCNWPARFAAAQAIVDGKSGALAIVLRDRKTGAVWRTGDTNTKMWTGSTIKLAMATHILESDRELSTAQSKDMRDMLSWSSDAAADRLWAQFGKHTMLGAFRERYGMSGLTMAGSNNDWGALACRADDLSNLMSYILDKLNLNDRSYLTNAMRKVSDVQHWGVWSAGADLNPGNKNGWLENFHSGQSHWCTSTVGFAGPDERYTLSIMYQMSPERDSLDLGARTLSDITAKVFGVTNPPKPTIRPT
ncbi:hypothetical protein [Longispora albida]|uniref:hypothetical protein n=1 Tax=Longispora albida TaxID=203523 RepID=UPI00036CE5B0|nr:hypothetical protein [Longispora albida]